MSPVSIIITTSHEVSILAKNLENILAELLTAKVLDWEIIVVAPDQETEQFIASYSSDDRLLFIKDDAHGKPSAMIKAFGIVNYGITVMTDGDVVIEMGSLSRIISHFSDLKVGLVSGRVLSGEPKTNRFGYWSNFLVDSAHVLRLKTVSQGGHIDASGYLYAIRKSIVSEIDELVFPGLLAEDIYLSRLAIKLGYKVAYEPEARVKVWYPKNTSDWLNQKKRTIAGVKQLNKIFVLDKNHRVMRSIKNEFATGLLYGLSYIHSLQEFRWLVELFILRIRVWLVARLYLRHREVDHSTGWARIESSKIIE